MLNNSSSPKHSSLQQQQQISQTASIMEPILRKLCDDPQMRAKSKALVESSLQELAEKLKESGLPSISSSLSAEQTTGSEQLTNLLLKHLASASTSPQQRFTMNTTETEDEQERNEGLIVVEKSPETDVAAADNSQQIEEELNRVDEEAPVKLVQPDESEESEQIAPNSANDDENKEQSALVDDSASAQKQKTAAEQLVQLRLVQQQLFAAQQQQQNSIRRVIFTTTPSTDTTYSSSTGSRRTSSASTTAASVAAVTADRLDANDDVVVVSHSQQFVAPTSLANTSNENSAFVNGNLNSMDRFSPIRRQSMLSPLDVKPSTNRFLPVPDSNSTQLLYQHNNRQFQAIKQQLSSFDERLLRMEMLFRKLEPLMMSLSSSSSGGIRTPQLNQHSNSQPTVVPLPLPTTSSTSSTAFLANNTRLPTTSGAPSTVANSGLGRLLDAANKNESQFTLDSLMSRASLRNSNLESSFINGSSSNLLPQQQHRRYSIQTEPSNLAENLTSSSPHFLAQQNRTLPNNNNNNGNVINNMLHHTRSVPAFQQQLSLSNNLNGSSTAVPTISSSSSSNKQQQFLDMVAAAAAAAASAAANNRGPNNNTDNNFSSQNFGNDNNNEPESFVMDDSDRLSVDSVLVEDSQVQAEVDEAKRLLKNALQAASDSPAQRIETRDVAARVNAVIHEHQISKQILARYLLNGTYKVAYDALHDPREWNYLSAQSREKYRRLKAFSESSDAIQAMKTLELHLKDRLTKRGRKQQQPNMVQMSAPTVNTVFANTGATPVGMMLAAPQQQQNLNAIQQSPNNNNALSSLFASANGGNGGTNNAALAAEMIARFQQSLANAAASNGSNSNSFQNMANSMLLNSAAAAAAAISGGAKNSDTNAARQQNNVQQQYQNMASLLQGNAATAPVTPQLTNTTGGGRKNRHPRRLDQLLTMSEQMTHENNTGGSTHAACGSSSVSASTSGSAGGNDSPSSSSSSPQPCTYNNKLNDASQQQSEQRNKEEVLQALIQQKQQQQQRMKQQEGSSTIAHHPTIPSSASQPQLNVLQQQQPMQQQQVLAAMLQRNLLNMNANSANGPVNNNTNVPTSNFNIISRAIQQMHLQQQQQQAAMAARATIFGASPNMPQTLASTHSQNHPTLHTQLSLQHEPQQQVVAAAAAAAAAAQQQQHQHAVVAAYHHQSGGISAPTMSAGTGTVNSSSSNSTTPNNTNNPSGGGISPSLIVPHPALQQHLSNLKSKKLSEHFIASPVALGLSFPDYRKQCLPQVTDEVIRRYEPLDTDQVTRAVRSKLAKGNVSQRLFGEVVLGMSQGAVSDLLKRPKAWEKLTRPTKEHYVRMQMFVEDEDCVRALQAIQNRENPSDSSDANSQASGGGLGGGCGGPGGFGSASGGVDEAGNIIISQEPEYLDAARVQQWREHLTLQYQLCLREARDSTEQPGSVNYARERNFFNQVREYFTRVYRAPDLSRSPPIDTQAVATDIREVLRQRNIQQKLIGELVLDVGQGTVSELLNKPKKYEMLSQRGRENYWKLQQLLLNNADFQLLESFRTSVPGRGPPAVSLKRKFSEVGSSGIAGMIAENGINADSAADETVAVQSRSATPDGDAYRHYNRSSGDGNDHEQPYSKMRRHNDGDGSERIEQSEEVDQLSFVSRLQSSSRAPIRFPLVQDNIPLDLRFKAQNSSYNNKNADNDDDDERNGLVIEDDDETPVNPSSRRFGSSGHVNLAKLLAGDLATASSNYLNSATNGKRRADDGDEQFACNDVSRFSRTAQDSNHRVSDNKNVDDEDDVADEPQQEETIVVEQEPVSGSWES